jgi:hypothetical protein
VTADDGRRKRRFIVVSGFIDIIRQRCAVRVHGFLILGFEKSGNSVFQKPQVPVLAEELAYSRYRYVLVR